VSSVRPQRSACAASARRPPAMWICPATWRRNGEEFPEDHRGDPQDVDYVADGWTELTRLEPVLSSKELAASGRSPPAKSASLQPR